MATETERERLYLYPFELNGNMAIFCKPMAVRTKANQISRTICLFVIVVLPFDIAKFAEWYDVVNIQLAPEFLFGYSAMLAFVAISFSGIPALSVPIGAIIINIAAPPYRAVFARHRHRMVRICALPATKVVLVFSQLFRHHRNISITPITLLFNSRVKRVAIALVMLAVTVSSTFFTTIMVIVSFATFGRNRNDLAAIVAWCVYRVFVRRIKTFFGAIKILSSTDIVRRPFNFFTAQSARHTFLFGSGKNATPIRTTMIWINDRLIGKLVKLFPTNLTNNRYRLCHTKSLLLTIDRLLVEGLPSSIGGNENNISLLATGQQLYAFDKVNYTIDRGCTQCLQI